MKVATLEQRSAARGTAVGTTGERVFLGSSTFSGEPLFIQREMLDPITGRPLKKYWGKMLSPNGPYIDPSGQKQAEDYQKFISSEED